MHLEGWEGRTELDQLVLELLDLVLQDPVCMLREERDDVLELCPHVSRSIYSIRAPRPGLTTYGHLPVINRVDMLKGINSRRLSSHHQRLITSSTQSSHSQWRMVRETS
jgi:hypothetical protein